MQAIIPYISSSSSTPTRPRHPYPSSHPSSSSISRLRRPFFHQHIPSYNIHRFRPSSTAGKRKEYHFFQSFGYLIITGLHWRLSFISPSFFSITMDFIHWLHRERGLELSIFSSNTNIFWLVWVHRQKGFKSNRAFTWFRRLTSLFIPHGKIWMVSFVLFIILRDLL